MKRIIIFLYCFVILLFAGRVQVCLDPGHGGTALGATNPRYGWNGPYEKDYNLYIAEVSLGDLLYGLSYTVSMTRINDVNRSLEDRVKMANGTMANPWTGQFDTCDVFVSIHNNGHYSRAAHGTETWYHDPCDSVFADYVHYNMFYYISNLPHANDRGLKQGNFYVITHTLCAACLPEGAFVTHDTVLDGQWFRNGMGSNLNI